MHISYFGCLKLCDKKVVKPLQGDKWSIELLKVKKKISLALNHAEPHSPAAEKLEAIKGQVKELILEVRLGRRQRLRNKLLKADPTRRHFWKFLKNQIKAAGNITAINDKCGKMVFNQEEIEEVIMLHFEGIFTLTLGLSQGSQTNIKVLYSIFI